MAQLSEMDPIDDVTPVDDMTKTPSLDFIELSSLKGHFLAASPAMDDSRFAESLILVTEHGEAGAVGFVINQAMDGLTLYSLIEQLSIDGTPAIDDHLIFAGGPVRPNNGFVLFEGKLGLRDEQHVFAETYVSRSLESLRLISQGRGPAAYLVCLGRAEWASGQLEAELRENVWLPLQADRDLIFAKDARLSWSAALKGQGIEPLNFTHVAGNA